jgi:MFS family permease
MRGTLRCYALAIMSETSRWPAPWVFGVLILPLGILVGFKTTPLPYLLAQAGIPVDRIATVSTLVNLPTLFVPLWGPLADVKLRRRTWLAISVFSSALAFCMYFPLTGATHLDLMTALILVAGVADSLIAAACGGLMARAISARDGNRASAWYQVGLLGGGALGGALVLWLVARLSLTTAGFLVALLIALPGLVAFTIPEAPPEASPWFKGRLKQIAGEFLALVRSPSRRWSVLLLLGPGSTGAAMFLLPAIASSYGVGGDGVLWINGAGGGLLLAVGALSGALVPSDWDRRLAYAAAGMTNALAVFILLGTPRPSLYLIGTVCYLITAGFCGACWTALTLEIVGANSRDTSTLFGAFTATASVSFLYMIWLDGVGYHHFGVRGLLWTDATANLLVFAIVVVVFLVCGLGVRRASADRTIG